jgi:hypothetical protein
MLSLFLVLKDCHGISFFPSNPLKMNTLQFFTSPINGGLWEQLSMVDFPVDVPGPGLWISSRSSSLSTSDNSDNVLGCGRDLRGKIKEKTQKSFI